MSNSKRNKHAQANIARNKRIEERMAAQKAAAAALKRKKIYILGGIAAGVILIIVLFVLWGPAIGGSSATMDGSVQRVSTSSNGGGSSNITVKSGTEVVWTISASSNLGCMTGFKANASLGIGGKTLSAGKSNTVRFTPKKKGTYTLRCTSMGMTYCKVTVT